MPYWNGCAKFMTQILMEVMVFKGHKVIQLEAKTSVEDFKKFSKRKRKHFRFFVQQQVKLNLGEESVKILR